MNRTTWYTSGEGPDRDSKLCLTRAIWNGAATGNGVYKLIVEKHEGHRWVSCRSGLLSFATGSRVTHPELGTGVFIGTEPGGYARVFFQKTRRAAGFGAQLLRRR